MRPSCPRHWFCRVGGALALLMTMGAAHAEGTSGALLPPAASVEPPAAASPASSAPTEKPARKSSPTKVAPRKVLHNVAPAPRRTAPATVSVFPPPPGESRFRRGEILAAFALNASRPNIDLLLRRHRLTEVEAVPVRLLGITWRLLRISDARDTGSVVRELGSEPLIVSAQPNYVYALQEDATGAALESAPQYALAKLHIDAPRTPAAAGDKILVAVIDTAIDEAHPDLAGVVEARFDAIAGEVSTRIHGTAIAGAIAAHGKILGVAPHTGILAVRAFETADSGPQGTTLAILKGIDWAAQAHARIINMSFAGPQDPAMHGILAAAFDKGIMLIAAAGNAGPKSAPLFPAADEKVLAVTATDADDKLFDNANVGRYVAVAAPGVDVLLPAPGGAYGLETGTSVSAALVSGVAALVLERRPTMQPSAMRKLLMTTATPLGAGGHEIEFGAGLVNAQRALAADGAAAR